MNKLYFTFLLVAVLCLSFGTAALAQSAPQVQTNSATSIQNNSAVLNGYLTYMGNNGNATVWFQWGTSTGYGYQTPSMAQNYAGSFSQTISGLQPYMTYHFRAVAQNNYGIISGYNNFTSNQSYNNYNNNYNSYGNIYVQTNSASNISGTQATLNGSFCENNYINNSYINSYNNYCNNSFSNSYNGYYWFQWGLDTNYGNNTPEQLLGSSSFSQLISNLNYDTTYHYRAVAQGNFGTIYGQDMTVLTFNNTNGYGNYYGSGSLTAQKQVIDLSSGNLNWQTSANAKPSDILSFSITLQAIGQNVNNVMVRDILPANLIYKGNLTVNTNSNFGGEVTAGVNIGTIYPGQPTVVAYQVQVAPASSFSYGATTLTNSATITGANFGTQTASATVVVNKSQVYGESTATGPSSVSTGLTNNFLTDSFFLPLLLIVAGLWFYFSGNIYNFSDWIKSKK